MPNMKIIPRVIQDFRAQLGSLICNYPYIAVQLHEPAAVVIILFYPYENWLLIYDSVQFNFQDISSKFRIVDIFVIAGLQTIFNTQ
jgi:hypothetical protein